MQGSLKIWARRRFRPKVVTVDGVRLSADLAVVSKEVRRGLYLDDYEVGERALARKHLTASDRVLEVGGGVGLVSLVCAGVVGAGNLRIYEPNPVACGAIRRNFALNGLEPDLRQAAVGEASGSGVFHIHTNIFSSSLIDRRGTTPTEVEIAGAADVLADFAPTVVVMDAEGAELTVLPLLAGASVRGIIVELHPHIVGEAECEALLQQMAEMGFAVADRFDAKVVWLERTPGH
ncbi:MAG: FkbM family methyltransferase [Rhodospirillaceae bacterium]|nr:FkbM family methyltransferase [Rhodospirillaceae bacterium]